MAVIEVRVPDIGDFSEVSVIEVLVEPGAIVEQDQALVVVESEKASMEIPCSDNGILKELKVAVGDKVAEGSLLLLLETDLSEAQTVATDAGTPSESPSIAEAQPPSSSKTDSGISETAQDILAMHASPSIRRRARQLGVTIQEVLQSSASISSMPSSGPELLPWPKVDFAKAGPIERKELPRIKKNSGANLMRNALMIPAVTNHDVVDITDIEAYRVAANAEKESVGGKLTMLAFLVKASVLALQKFPDFNSSLDGDALIYKKYWHIGFAVDTPNGLVVPVIKNADQKTVHQIGEELAGLARRGRDGILSPSEMSGATFTISSLGGLGGRYFTPIINAPEVAILGVSKSFMEQTWSGESFQPRLMLPLSLTWDHRVIDGAAATRFNTYLGEVLANFRTTLL